MAHLSGGAPLLYTTGAPSGDAPLVWKTLMAHQKNGAPLVVKFFFHSYIHTNGASDRSAPLLVLTSNGALGRPCAISIYIYIFYFFVKLLMAHHLQVRH